MVKKVIALSLSLMLFFTEAVAALCLQPDIKGRVDGGPAYFQVKVQESGKTVNKLEMYGARFDSTILFIKDSGICLKPFIFGAGGDGHIFGAGCSIGHYTPIGKCLSFNPFVGLSYTNLSNHIDFSVPGIGIVPNVKQRFRSHSTYVGGDLTYNFSECLSITGTYMYAWAHTKTTLNQIGETTGDSQGSNYAVTVDYWIRKNISLLVAGGYNSSLDKEKFGIEGFGVKVGVSYLFGVK